MGATPPTNAVSAQQMINAGRRQAALRRGRRCDLQHCPEPRFIGAWAQREHLGYEPMHLTPQLVGQAAKFRVQIFLCTREFPELHHDGVLAVHLLKRGRVGPQRIRQDPRIPTIVLRAGDRVPIAKPIELLRIHREHQQPARETRIHQCTTRRFDGDRDLRRRGSSECHDPVETRLHRIRRVVHTALFPAMPSRIDHTDGMTLAAPIDPDIPRHLFHLASLSITIGRGALSALYWRSLGAIPHGTCTADSPSRHRSTPGAAVARATPGVLDGATGTHRFSSIRLWKLPEPWTHRTRPPLLGNHRTVSTATTRHSSLSLSLIL